MLESFNVNHEMEYQKLSPEEQQQRGILGRLVGIIADFKNPTRNGRRYTEELWDKTFNNPIMKEKFENRCLFGELGHPVDRQEVDMEKVAICLAEPPKKGTDGKLYGVFDILATPNGRILKTFCDYGCKIGVSSRGSGDTFEDDDGGETVEPDSYECECWDAVLLPAVKDARPQYVNESLDTKRTLKKALQEALNNSTDEERKTMVETLDSLEVEYESSQDEFVSDEVNTENNPEKVDNIDTVVEETSLAAEDSGAAMVQELQEALVAKQEAEKQLKSLQEQLSVCYTKEARYSEILSRTKAQLVNATNLNTSLEDQLRTANDAIEQRNATLSEQQETINSLKSKLMEGRTQRKTLDESLSGKDSQIRILQEQVSSLTEKFNQEKITLKQENKQLSESLEDSKKDLQILRSQTNAKLTKSAELIEKYKTIARTAVDRYIKSQASRLGINPEDIKGKLNENYSFNDIDDVCESLRKYKLTVNSLPFNVGNKTPVKMSIRESKEVITPGYNDDRIDDDIDTTLINFIN